MGGVNILFPLFRFLFYPLYPVLINPVKGIHPPLFTSAKGFGEERCTAFLEGSWQSLDDKYILLHFEVSKHISQYKFCMNFCFKSLQKFVIISL